MARLVIQQLEPLKIFRQRTNDLAVRRLRHNGKSALNTNKNRDALSYNLPNLRLGQGSFCLLQSGKLTVVPDGMAAETRSFGRGVLGEAMPGLMCPDDWWPL